MDILQRVRQTIEKNRLFAPGETVVIGVSGGPDSLCLLHVLNELRGELGIELHIGHLNHQLRGEEAEADALFVADLAGQWGLPATVEARDVSSYAQEQKLAIEEAARRVRYAFLAQLAGKVGASSVVVGHNADDQVETVLMHWLRGAGLAGLRGMRSLSPYPLPRYRSLKLVRPLLEVTRAQIEGYCAEHGLKPRFDRSNLDTTYYRNRLRHELLPYLEAYNPSIREVLRRAAMAIADDYDYLRQRGGQAWARLADEEEGAIVFALRPWLELHPSLQRQLLREAIRRLRRGLRNINWVHIEDALGVAKEKPAGTKATLPQGLFLFKGYDELVVGQERPRPDWPLLSVDSLPLTIPGTTKLPQSEWRVEAELISRDEIPPHALKGEDRWQAYLDYDGTGTDLVMRRRRSGDRFQPLGMGGHEKSLQEFMIDQKIPAHIRHQIPIVVSPGGIVWVAGWHIDERVRVRKGTKRVLHLRFFKPPPDASAQQDCASSVVSR